MARAIGISVLGIALIAVVMGIGRHQAMDSTPGSLATSGSGSDTKGEQFVSMPEIALDPGVVSTAQTEIDVERAAIVFSEARIRYAAAQAAVAKAQDSIAESERDLDELEHFVELLEARGENPADHAEEGMKRFNPAFDSYESASAELDRAESEVEIERVKLLGAEEEWKAARRRAGLE